MWCGPHGRQVRAPFLGQPGACGVHGEVGDASWRHSVAGAGARLGATGRCVGGSGSRGRVTVCVVKA